MLLLLCVVFFVFVRIINVTQAAPVLDLKGDILTRFPGLAPLSISRRTQMERGTPVWDYARVEPITLNMGVMPLKNWSYCLFVYL